MEGEPDEPYHHEHRLEKSDSEGEPDTQPSDSEGEPDTQPSDSEGEPDTQPPDDGNGES
jgi:hypothetical protein